ncbi:MoaD/ThiS family protein [Clostridium psychrophilum]|uniref:MoaD/ThiS family protein n=1 Tax=Clostridium psychrophilum TaxID=132926 RepID=UPI001C0BF4EE|nr:MoaD/ThiS family protein [Clostridium psychrophilum]MBU3181110.1 MoaD/ThiS family protein [Clostridium psychrophilum]
MKVLVKVFATFREGRQKIQTLELEEGSTPKDIFKILGIEESEIAIMLRNGRDRENDIKLADGDTISLFPPVGGG